MVRGVSLLPGIFHTDFRFEPSMAALLCAQNRDNRPDQAMIRLLFELRCDVNDGVLSNVEIRGLAFEGRMPVLGQ
jgi:hypothetical protein